MNSIEIKELCIIGKAMGLHDFRRAASAFLAIDAPEKISLIPRVLQHASPDTNEQHYNLARSVQAGQRFAAHLANARNRLRTLVIATRQSRHQTSSNRKDPKLVLSISKSRTIAHRDRGEPSCA
jgi:integrase